MPTPDPRPAGETAVALCEAFDACMSGVMADAHGDEADLNTLVHDFYDALEAREDAVAAEARAALLAGAPVVWVATDRGARISHLSPGRWEMYDGIAFAYEDSESMPLWSHPPLTPPGTCVRYRLVPDPEET